MPRRKRLERPAVPSSSWFIDPKGYRHWVSAQYQPDGDVFLYVPRDGRYWAWHKPYWIGTPEYARYRDFMSGLHWVFEPYAATQVSVLLAFYPEAVVIPV